MKCIKCHLTMNVIRSDKGTYFKCPKCGKEVGKPEEEKKEEEK